MLLKAWSKAGNDLAARATRAAIREQMAGTRLGARAIVHGNLAQWGQGCQLPFKLLRPSNGYPDTVVLFTPTLLPPPGIVEELRRVNRGIVFKTIKRAQEGGIWGWKITVQQLSEPAVWVLDDYATRFDGKLSRLDVSIEFWPDCSFSLNSWLRDHLLLWFRAAGPMLVCENTVSWVDFRGGSAPARNGTLYTDLRASKLNGRLGSHLDTKICRARTIQRLGIHRPLDLLTLNPSELLPKVWRLVISVCLYWNCQQN